MPCLHALPPPLRKYRLKISPLFFLHQMWTLMELIFFFSIFCFLRCFSLEFNSTWNHYGSTKQLKIFNSSTAACSIDSCTEKLELLFCFSTGMENMVLSTDTGPTPGKFFLSFMSMTPTWHHQSPGLNCWLLRAHTASEEHLTMPFSWPW